MSQTINNPLIILKIFINDAKKHKYISLKESIRVVDFNPNTERLLAPTEQKIGSWLRHALRS